MTYKRLLKGLEVSEAGLNEVTRTTEHRLDADFFAHTKSVWIDSLLAKNEFTTIKDISSYISSGHTPYKHDMSQGSVKFITVECISNLSLSEDKIKRITEEHFEKEFQKNFIRKGSVLCTIKRRICQAFPFIDEVKEPIAINQDVAIIIPDNRINAAYLAAYLNCKIGQTLADKQKTGQMNPYISVANLSELPVYIPSKIFQLKIESVIKQAYKIQEYIKTLHQQAENILLDALGLDHNTLAELQKSQKTVNDNIKSFSNSFLLSGRLDAEFYQKKYERLEQHLIPFRKIKVADLVDYPVSSGSTPKAGGSDYSDSDTGVPFIRAVDLQNSLVSTINLLYLKPEVHETILKKTRLKKGDVLISIAGTVGRCALFDYDFSANINQAVAILRFSQKELLHLYVVTFFNSKVGEMYISKYSRQGLQTNLNLSEVSALEIPVIPMEKQIEIVNNLEESFLCSKKSQTLLDLAKRAVEVAIEEGEEKALQLICLHLNEPLGI